jgi:hypothetical protein
VDHAISLSFGFFLILAALSLVQDPILETLSRVGASFWLPFFATLFVASLLQRAFFIIMFGSTFGNLLFHVRPSEDAEEKPFWFGQVMESLQVAFPALWMLEILLRYANRKTLLGLDYKFYHS